MPCLPPCCSWSRNNSVLWLFSGSAGKGTHFLNPHGYRDCCNGYHPAQHPWIPVDCYTALLTLSHQHLLLWRTSLSSLLISAAWVMHPRRWTGCLGLIAGISTLSFISDASQKTGIIKVNQPINPLTHYAMNLRICWIEPFIKPTSRIPRPFLGVLKMSSSTNTQLWVS